MLDKTPEHIRLDEKHHVEEPFLEELESLGWEVLRLGNEELKRPQIPKDSFRESFSEVILLPKLREAIKKINPWIEDDQVEEIIRRITQPPKSSLIEANQYVLNLLLENTSVSENRKTGERSPTVRYIDFNHPENNSFIAISQFKVRILGTENHICPDIVLFVNGLPFVVVECKSPKLQEPIPEAIQQLLRYSEQRGESKEGNKTLFYYNQFVVATCRNICKFGTISCHIEKFFFRWTDPYPKTIADISKGGKTPNDQERLIHGMLDKKNLLSLVKTFTLFSENEKGQIIKIVGRYQQFRAVKKIIDRLLSGKNKLQRGGIVWHTQGSGKSLTMMFTVREMYAHPQLRDWKVVFITDRTQLEGQLKDTSKSIGFSVKVADSIKKLKELIKNPSSDLVMAMIHKFQERELDEVFPELNPSPKILIMVDEAHRSQYKKLAANLDKALPQATYIAYTGTPTDRTEKKFKDYIDKYTMRQSIEDGVTLEIVYEGRTQKAGIGNKKKMDEKFADVFSDYNIEERLRILRYGSKQAYLEAKETISEKAKDMVNHYVEQVFPNGFKAQVVACSREAAVRYKEAIDSALKEKIKVLEKNNPYLINLRLLRKLKTAVVISGAQNDPPHLKKYTDPTQHKKDIKSFKLAFEAEDEGIKGNVGIIIVNEMLITGFDAPLEQVMYLDQVIKAHNLLQAIARVNRVYENKNCGFVVDYVGVGHHLKEALDVFYEKEQKEILNTFENEQDEINELKLAHQKMIEFFEKYNIKNLKDYDSVFDVFYDEDIRFEFIEKFRKFAKALDVVFPKKEALTYLSDFKIFSEINILASKHLRDNRLSMKGVPEKLRKIADEYLISKGIDQKVPPISIIDAKFSDTVKKIKRKKTKAAEVEHAIRHFINEKYNEDPILYAKFSEMLEQILRDFKNNWDKIYEKLEELRNIIKNTDKEPTYGLDRKKQMPFFRIIKDVIYPNKEPNKKEIDVLVNLTQECYDIIERELKLPDFWANIPAINRLKGDLQSTLLSQDYSSLPGIKTGWKSIISRMLEVAEANNDIILYG
ncbi:MAG: HsdR family type I site-specific deoxyribonuclease [Candidatus Aenigmatarchaeota archaeon]